MSNLCEIIIGTSLCDYRAFEKAKEWYVCEQMFEDDILKSFFAYMDDAYKKGKYDKQSGMFDFVDIYKDDFKRMQRLIDCVGENEFNMLKHNYNSECLLTGKGKWTDMTFDDYCKRFVKEYVEKCKKARGMRTR